MKVLENKIRELKSQMLEPMVVRSLIYNWLDTNLSLPHEAMFNSVVLLDIRNHESIQLFLFNVEDLAS